jgi:hypothetical protein
MSKPVISVVLTDADKLAIITNIKNSKLLMPWLVNLTNDERMYMRKTGSKREGYVKDVYDTSIANPSALPAEFKLEEWTKVETLIKQTIEVKGVISSFLEGIDDTILLLGADRIHYADLAYGYLKQSAKNNTSITNDLEKISRQFDGMGRKKNVSTFTVGPNSKVEVGNVVVSTLVINEGDTVLRFKPGADLANVVKMLPVTINPGNSAMIPDKCTTIEIENLSKDTVGAFSVKTK